MEKTNKEANVGDHVKITRYDGKEVLTFAKITYVGGYGNYRAIHVSGDELTKYKGCYYLDAFDRFEIVDLDEADADNQPDTVDSPAHYTQGGVEVIDIIAQTVAGYDDPFVGHCVGTATKYLNRAPHKHDEPTEDLRKASKYIAFAIEHLAKDGE